MLTCKDNQLYLRGYFIGYLRRFITCQCGCKDFYDEILEKDSKADLNNSKGADLLSISFYTISSLTQEVAEKYMEGIKKPKVIYNHLKDTAVKKKISSNKIELMLAEISYMMLNNYYLSMLHIDAASKSKPSLLESMLIRHLL